MTTIIKVCTHCSCEKAFANESLKAAEKTLGIKVGETTKDGRFRLEKSGCLGQCSKAPNVMFCSDTPLDNMMNQGELHTGMLPPRFKKLLREKLQAGD